jgi:putative flippase GtrA
MNQFIRFVLVGIINTAWGYGLIFGFMYLFSFPPTVSNALGYAISLVSSYLLHRLFTFRSKGGKRGEFVRFLCVFAIAYGANYIALHFLLARGINPYVCQIGAGVVYVVTSYLLGKAFVFKSHRATLS